LAQIHESSLRKLFSPFWRSISAGVVKQLQSKPQIAQLLSELLGIDLIDFLKMTQSFTLPYLILWKRVELVERVAQACGMDAASVCHENMPAIMALLLTQDVDNIENFTMSLLEGASAEFKEVSIAELVRPEAISIAAELLKVASDEDDDKKARVSLSVPCITS
jgi:serine/threonine-protein kinase ATR